MDSEIVDLAAYRAAKLKAEERERSRQRRIFDYQDYIVTDLDINVFVPLWVLRQNGQLRRPRPQLYVVR